MLAQKNPSLKEQRQWAIIGEDYDNLYHLMTDYENYRNQFRMKSTYINVLELCEKIASQFQTIASKRKIAFSFENKMTHPQILYHYFGDAEKLEDAIIGLLKHAFHIIPDVTYVKVSLYNEGTKKSVIHVERNGAMIPERDLQDLQREQISKELYTKHIGVLTAKQLAASCGYDFNIFSSEEQTYVDFIIPALKTKTV